MPLLSLMTLDVYALSKMQCHISTAVNSKILSLQP